VVQISLQLRDASRVEQTGQYWEGTSSSNRRSAGLGCSWGAGSLIVRPEVYNTTRSSGKAGQP